MDRKLSTTFAMLVILLIGLIPAWLIIINFGQESIFNYDYASAALESGQNKPRACTEEAKICPDGSAVGRTGPNCEFALCPENKLVGGDKDEHGCIGSAGYSWCEIKQKCLRVWEEKCGN